MIHQQTILSAECDGYSVRIYSENRSLYGSDITLYGLMIQYASNVADCFPEITDNKESILRLFELFTEFDIDRSHICDVVEDFVAEMHFIK